ncbi:protein kinase family protein [Candidatus Uabimicrobium sp. HlEnr_7]|uniref:protein kinase family protein n=1 Tax=Candidatus Uabimicrobium helgolandensis TaxID=3095367 RepID=UPI0035589544
MSEKRSRESHRQQPLVTQINALQTSQKNKQENFQVGKIFNNYYIEYKFENHNITNLYRGIEQTTSVPVLIREFDVEDNDFCEYLQWEYQFLNSTNHPNILKALELIHCKKQIYIVFEFAEGLSLKEILTEQRKISWSDKIAIAYNVANCIETLNGVGIIIRDMKPANIIVNQQNNHIKLMYLGLESPSNKKKLRVTLRNKIDESVMYFSPEQTEGRITDRSNIFSLGAIFYQLFANKKRSPFYSDNPFSCCYMIGSHNPLVLEKVINSRDIDKEIRGHISNIVKRAMQKNDRERWESAMQISARLAQCYLAMVHKNNKYLKEALSFQPQINLSGKEEQIHEKEKITSLVLDIDNIEIELPRAKEQVNSNSPENPMKNKVVTDAPNVMPNLHQKPAPTLERSTQIATKPKIYSKRLKKSIDFKNNLPQILSQKITTKYKLVLAILIISNAVVAYWLLFSSNSKAKAKLDDKISSKPQYSQAQNLIAQKKYLLATRLLQKVITLDKKNVNAYYDLAQCYQLFGEHTKAITHYNKMLRLQKNANAYYEKGNCYTHLISYAQAVSAYKKSMDINPRSPLAMKALADIFYKTEQHTKAIYYYKAALQVTKSIDRKANIHLHIGSSFFQQKDYNTAVKHYSKVIELKPQQANAYNNRAITYNLLGMKELAAKDLSVFRKLKIK